MYDDKAEDDKPVLSELDSVLNKEPTLEELDEEMDRFGFTKDKAWTITDEERASILLEEPVPTGGSSSSGTASGVTEASPTPVKARAENFERV